MNGMNSLIIYTIIFSVFTLYFSFKEYLSNDSKSMNFKFILGCVIIIIIINIILLTKN